jgi:hypothetical protein
VASAGVSTARAQNSKIVGQITCSGTTGGNASVEVTGYLVDLQNTSSTGSQSTGAGAGKVTFSEAEVEVPATDFSELASALSTGQEFSSCRLTTSGADGLQLHFALVEIAEVKLMGGTSETTDMPRNSEPVVLVSFEYGGLQISSNGQSGSPVPVTSGGGNPSGTGWNRISNK